MIVASKMDCKMVPELVQELLNFRSIFGSLWGLCRCPRPVFLGIPRLSWMALDPKKRDTIFLLRFLQMQVLSTLKLLTFWFWTFWFWTNK